jgi:hypothetical protein
MKTRIEEEKERGGKDEKKKQHKRMERNEIY